MTTLTRCCTLPSGILVTEVADLCRSAALGFAWGAREWSRRELAHWLVGPYARAVAPARALRSSASKPAVNPRALDEYEIHEYLARSHDELLEWLRGAWKWSSDTASAREAVDLGLAGGVVDAASGIGYAPIDQPRMSLVARVRSLFVADYLTRPSDYAAFVVCSECDGATFDGSFSHLSCERPMPSRVLRRRAPVAFDLDLELEARALELPTGRATG